MHTLNLLSDQHISHPSIHSNQPLTYIKPKYWIISVLYRNSQTRATIPSHAIPWTKNHSKYSKSMAKGFSEWRAWRFVGVTFKEISIASIESKQTILKSRPLRTDCIIKSHMVLSFTIAKWRNNFEIFSWKVKSLPLWLKIPVMNMYQVGVVNK